MKKEQKYKKKIEIHNIALKIGKKEQKIKTLLNKYR